MSDQTPGHPGLGDDADAPGSVSRPEPAPRREPALPPEHVLAAFGVAGTPATRPVGGSGRVWRYADVVLKPAREPVAAAWAAGVFESLRVSDIRVPRPVRSLDGRWVVGGWCAERFVSGRPAPRYADALTAAASLHDSLRRVPAPRFSRERTDLAGWADRLAWDEAARGDPGLPPGRGAELWFRIAALRRPVRADDQVVHCDLFGNVLFAGSAPPAVIGFDPLYRPATFASAVLVVDAVAWGGAPAALAEAGTASAEWAQVLRRAVLFRLAMGLAHPRTTPEAVVGIMTAAHALAPDPAGYAPGR